jgi:hypothetical protein
MKTVLILFWIAVGVFMAWSINRLVNEPGSKP